jgi:uncharacterized membrane protein YphA (DoxX/SURF4 family)
MDDSMSQPSRRLWQARVSLVFAILLGILFIAAGLWKLTDPIGWSAKMLQIKVPAGLTLPGALAVGVGDLLAGVLLFVPRFRRWGGWLAAGLLVIYMAYFGVNYHTLRGEECSCFPWLKRTVGPAFFVVDSIWMLMAFAAARWAPPSSGLGGAALVLASVGVFAGVSYGVQATRQSGLRAPDQIAVDGQPQSLQTGVVFLYFFDPECMHCFDAAKRMAGYRWKQPVRVITVPTRAPQFARQFLADTGLQAPASSDGDLLRATFQFGDPPYAVLLESGRQREAFLRFDHQEPQGWLQKSGYIE